MKILIIIALTLTSIVSKAQFYMLPTKKVTPTNFRGIWGFGNTTLSFDLANYAGPHSWKGYQLLMDWGEVETSDNVFDWSVVDSRITTILNANLEAGLEFLVGK